MTGATRPPGRAADRDDGTAQQAPADGTAQRAGNDSETAGYAPRRQRMWAITHSRYGSADVLRIQEVDRPALGDDAGRLQPGQHVLITGASGGVGTFAVQIATSMGAEVTGVCSTANTGLVRSIGADHVLDYTRDDVTGGGRRYDLILDLAGHTPLSRLRRVLTTTGTLVLAGGENGGRWIGMGRQARAVALSPFVRQRLTMLMSTQNHAGLEELARLTRTGNVTPVIGGSYPLHRAPDAMRQLVGGHADGKLAITVNGPA